LTKRIQILIRFIRYFWRAKTRYQIHSPFLFDFTEEVLEDNRNFYAFEQIESIRKDHLISTSSIMVTDLGAGSHVIKTKERKIKNIAQSSLTSSFYCQLLFKIINHYKPKTILELGTCFGVSTLYQSSAALNAQVITLEGCPQIAKVANKSFSAMKAKNIELSIGRFEDTLPTALGKLGKLDYVFIDGNHRKQPTIDYFNQCLKYAHEDSIFIFDDIHWSVGMEEAWEVIKKHPQVKSTIDLFFFGIVVFKKDIKVKTHSTLIQAKWKPWIMGFLK